MCSDEKEFMEYTIARRRSLRATILPGHELRSFWLFPSHAMTIFSKIDGWIDVIKMRGQG
jgi:hypothetical protein